MGGLPMKRFAFASSFTAAILASVALASSAWAVADKLSVGDPAPPLSVSTWLQGSEVKNFEPGKVYVVEFWATWCGPCIVMMPHLAELQERYRGQGVVVVGYTAKDDNNGAEKVAAFVTKRGPKLGYT